MLAILPRKRRDKMKRYSLPEKYPYVLRRECIIHGEAFGTKVARSLKKIYHCLFYNNKTCITPIEKYTKLIKIHNDKIFRNDSILLNKLLLII